MSTHWENDSSESTTWEWRLTRVRRGAAGQGDSRPKDVHPRRRPPRDPRKPLTVTVKYRGGTEAWYELRARGTVARFPGSTALHDVMRVLNGER